MSDSSKEGFSNFLKKSSTDSVLLASDVYKFYFPLASIERVSVTLRMQ